MRSRDLVGRNLNGFDARRVLRALRARSIKNRIHLVEQEDTALAGLLHCLLQNLAGQAADLMSIWSAVIPLRVPATLKSISP